MTSLVVEVPGSSVEIEAPVPTGDELARSLIDLPQGGAIDHRLELVERDGTLDLLCDGDIVRGGVDPRVAAATVVWKLNSFVAASPDHVVIHAGSVAGVGAVLLAGPSGCGKTTLSAACLRRGMSYLSDEFAVLDLATGLVVPYWKPLGFADDSLVPATHLLSDCLGEASAPCCIVFPEHAPEAPQGFDHVEPAFGLLGLAANTFDLAGAGGLKFRMVAGLATQADALRLTHHDAPGVAGEIAERARDPASGVAPLHAYGPVTRSTITVELDDRFVVLAPDGSVHVLNSTASAIWACVTDDLTTLDVVERVLDTEDTSTLDRVTVVETVNTFEREGLLR